MSEVLQRDETLLAPDPRVTRRGGPVRLIVAWHAVGAVLTGIGLWSVLAPSSDGLPGVIRTFLIAFLTVAVVANVAAAVGLLNGSRSGRTISLVINYLVFVVMGAVVLHRLFVFNGFSAFAGGFAQGIWLLLVGFVGVLWWWAGAALSKRAPASGAVRAFTIAAKVVVFAAMGGLLLYGLLGWLGHLDPASRTDPSWSGDLGKGVTELFDRILDLLTLGALLLAIGAVLAFRVMWKPAMATRFGASNEQTQALTGLLFLSPNILGLLAFFGGPLLFSLVISFFNWDAIGQTRDFVGFGNYAEILSLDIAKTAAGNARAAEVLKPGYLELIHLDWFGQHWLIGARDKVFWLSLRNIVIFLVLAVPLSVLPALVLSTILNSKLRGVKLFRAVFFIPAVAGVIGVTLIWRDLYGATTGWINYLLTRGAEILPFVSDPTTPVQQPWLTSTSTALVSIVVVFAWMTFGFNTVLYLAGHQAIPGDLYEAAELDGANAWQRFKRITVPQLRNTTFYVVATTSILAMQLFDIVWVLTNPPGSPDNATQTPVLHLYQRGFQESRQGYASAVAWVLFILIFGLTVAQFRRQRAEAGA